jgi:hypothetical protein
MKISMFKSRTLRSTAISTLACAGLLQACSSPVSKRSAADFQSQLNAGDYAAAAGTAIRSGQIGPDGKSQNLVWSLNAGATLLDAKDPKRAVAVLDNVETLMQADDVDHMKSALDYKYTTYDGVMANTYKALAFLEQGDSNNAGVEFRRAEDRQRRAEEFFQREVAASQKQAGQNKAADLQALLGKATQSDQYRNEATNLSQMATAYAPFENPFATWLGGIFLLTQKDATASDREAGLTQLQRASSLLGPHAAGVQSDLAWAHDVVHGHSGAPQTWVIFENGQSATFHELRLTLPMVTGQPMTVAIPALAANAPASAHLTVKAGSVTAATTSVGSFDAVMASEFQKRMPLVLTAAIAEVVLKNGMAVAAQKVDNPLLRMATAKVANTSTADTRSWTALPKEFQAVRVATPADGQVTISTAEGVSLGNIQVPTDRPSIIYVKIQHTGAAPSIQVAKL